LGFRFSLRIFGETLGEKRVKPLLDADILLYEIGFSSQQIVDNRVVPNSWEFCQELLDRRISLICDEVQATEEPKLFLTNTRSLNRSLNKKRAYEDKPKKEYVENFRNEVAKEKEYKAGRKPDKPFHYNNIREYLLSTYDVHVDENGLEADDALCIQQYARWKEGINDTVICSRDKDVRQCPGFHYSWEVGKQPSIGPIMVDELGILERKSPTKVFGTGNKFFYYQLLVGDIVDNIGGVKGRGPAFALNLLQNAKSVRQCYELVAEVYVKHWGDVWKDKMREQADLLWMIRELNEEGEKVKWRPPKIEIA